MLISSSPTAFLRSIELPKSILMGGCTWAAYVLTSYMQRLEFVDMLEESGDNSINYKIDFVRLQSVHDEVLTLNFSAYYYLLKQ